jgi:hypothetical protein
MENPLYFPSLRAACASVALQDLGLQHRNTTSDIHTTGQEPDKSTKSASRFFNIPELHEIILEPPSFFRLLQLRLVSRQWRSVIENSLPLRRTLFLAAIPGEGLTLDKTPSSKLGIVRLDGKFSQVNLLFPDGIMGDRPHRSSAALGQMDHRFGFNNVPVEEKPELLPFPSTFLCNMFLTLPPIPAVELCITSHNGRRINSAVLRNDKYLKLGELIDVLGEMLRECDRHGWGQTIMHLGRDFFVHKTSPAVEMEG